MPRTTRQRVVLSYGSLGYMPFAISRRSSRMAENSIHRLTELVSGAVVICL